MNTRKLVLALVSISLATTTGILMPTSSAGERVEQGKSTANEEFTVLVPLNQSSVTILDTEKHQQVTVPVILRRTGRFTQPTRYQLRSADGAIEYVHEVRLRNGGVGWRLFSGGPGANYLAWVSESDVGIKEISRMTDSSEDEPVTLRQSQFLPRENLRSTLSRSAVDSDTEILHVGKDLAGVLRVKTRDPVTGRIFSFTFDGKVWRGYTSDGVELPPKWE